MTTSTKQKTDVAARRREIGRHYLQGKTQAEIASLQEVSQPTISRDLRWLREQWLQSALIDINEAKARELAKIDALELTYWAAWERSCEDAETLQQVGGKEGPDKITKTSKDQAGDPRFLQGVQWCIERRCKILGVDAPEKKELSGKIETKTNVTGLDKGIAEAVALLEKARERSTAGNPPSNNQ